MLFDIHNEYPLSTMKLFCNFELEYGKLSDIPLIKKSTNGFNRDIKENFKKYSKNMKKNFRRFSVNLQKIFKRY